MNESQANINIDIDTKIKEAELYRSMGLVVESIGIYEQILLDDPELDGQKRKPSQRRLSC